MGTVILRKRLVILLTYGLPVVYVPNINLRYNNLLYRDFTFT